MAATLLELIQGQHYKLRSQENDLFEVDPSGKSIRIGIKNRNGQAFSWVEPSHPFEASPNAPRILSQDAWEQFVEVPSEDVFRLVLTREGERRSVTLTVTDPTAAIKPVSVQFD